MKIVKKLEKFYEISNIPVGLFDYKYRIAIFPDFGIMPTFTIPEYIDFKVNGIFYKHTISNAFLHHGFIYAKKEDLFIFVGLIAENNINSNIIRETITEYNQEKNADISNLINYFSKTPKMTMSKFGKYLSFLYYLVNDEEPPINDSNFEIEKENISIEPEEINVIHNSYDLEKELLSLIEFGKTEELNKLILNISFSGANIGITSMNSVKNFKNIFITSAVLGSRSAINGGLDYENALSLSDSYLLKLEQLNKYNDIFTLWVNMLLDFSSRVNKIKRLNAKKQISFQVFNYALANVYSSLSVSDIADQLNINRSYLSRVFKEDTGKNLSTYLNEIKIDEAKRLLRYTDINLVHISTLLGFSTQNYFHKIFKDITNQTPIEYRDNKTNQLD